MCFRKFAQLPMIVALIKITDNSSDMKTARIFKLLFLRETFFDRDFIKKKAL